MVVVGEGDVGVYFVDVGGGMEVVVFDVVGVVVLVEGLVDVGFVVIGDIYDD